MTKEALTLTPFEKDVMRFIIERVDPSEIFVATQQFEQARITERWLDDDGGFIIYFEVPPHLPRLGAEGSEGALSVGCVAMIEGMVHGAAFLVLLKDGLLHCLDGYAQGAEVWPQPIGKYQLFPWDDAPDPPSSI